MTWPLLYIGITRRITLKVQSQSHLEDNLFNRPREALSNLFLKVTQGWEYNSMVEHLPSMNFCSDGH